MPTAKKRINLSVDEETLNSLEYIANLREIPITTLSNELLMSGLELIEDQYWSQTADELLENEITTVSHDDIWGEK